MAHRQRRQTLGFRCGIGVRYPMPERVYIHVDVWRCSFRVFGFGSGRLRGVRGGWVAALGTAAGVGDRCCVWWPRWDVTYGAVSGFS